MDRHGWSVDRMCPQILVQCQMRSSGHPSDTRVPFTDGTRPEILPTADIILFRSRQEPRLFNRERSVSLEKNL